ncbi:MAG: hypothetical protein KGI29_07425 [Pseudomonadota bacterium]|nr:hypothetical protein [Pseudomonadota bacterium]MDE3037729.1 hypothetical protein [Pseudomonadota bacterium]
MEKITEFFTNAFGTADNPKLGGLVGGGLVAALGGLIGFIFGPVGSAVGAGIGLLLGGAMMSGGVKELINNVTTKFGSDGRIPPYSTGVQPSREAVSNVSVSVHQVGQPPDSHIIPVPGMDHFQELLNKMKTFDVTALVSQRQHIVALPEGDERRGAVEILKTQQDIAAQFLRDVQAWNEAAKKWEEKKRPGLITSLTNAQNNVSPPVDALVVPNAPLIPVVINISPRLHTYAERLFVAKNEGNVEDFNAKLPQDRIFWLANQLREDLEKNKPDWNKTGRKMWWGGRDRTTSWSLEGQKYLLSDRMVSAAQSDAEYLYRKAIEHRRYDDAIQYAKEGQQWAKRGEDEYYTQGLLGIKLGSEDEDAQKEFVKAGKYAETLKWQADLDLVLNKLYDNIRSAQDTVRGTKLPGFIANVNGLKEQIDGLNQKTNAQAAIPEVEKSQPAKTEDSAALISHPGTEDIMKIADANLLGGLSSQSLPGVDKKSKYILSQYQGNVIG